MNKLIALVHEMPQKEQTKFTIVPIVKNEI